MNIKLNMKDFNKILAKAHFKYKYIKKNDEKKTTTHFCRIMSVGSLPVMPSLLPHVL